MAFNQNVPFVRADQHLQTVASSLSINTLNRTEVEPTRRYDELSSSGIDSDWILFSPSNDSNEQGTEYSGDVLSTSGGQLSLYGEDEERDEEEDEDDDNDSLIDSLNTNDDLRLSLPEHNGTGAFIQGSRSDDSEADNYYSSLSKNDHITNRIDVWRKEQARLLIDDLHKTSEASLSTTRDDLLASWGVDDSHLDMSNSNFITDATKTETVQSTKSKETYQYNQQKRFYGDDLFENFTEWEVSKIKQVAKHLSSSLVRDLRSRSSHDRHQIQRSGRRSSILHNLTQASNISIVDSANLLFWRKDLSSAHSSLSMSTNSIMFGNITLGDVM